jgi:hypothetical protein
VIDFNNPKISDLIAAGAKFTSTGDESSHYKYRFDFETGGENIAAFNNPQYLRNLVNQFASTYSFDTNNFPLIELYQSPSALFYQIKASDFKVRIFGNTMSTDPNAYADPVLFKWQIVDTREAVRKAWGRVTSSVTVHEVKVDSIPDLETRKTLKNFLPLKSFSRELNLNAWLFNDYKPFSASDMSYGIKGVSKNEQGTLIYSDSFFAIDLPYYRVTFFTRVSKSGMKGSKPDVFVA